MFGLQNNPKRRSSWSRFASTPPYDFFGVDQIVVVTLEESLVERSLRAESPHQPRQFEVGMREQFLREVGARVTIPITTEWVNVKTPHYD